MMQEKSFKEIVIPGNIDEVVDSAIRKGKRTIIKKNIVAMLGALSIFMISVFGTCYASPSVAYGLSKIPIIGTIFLQFTDEGLRNVSENGLTSTPNMQVTKQGATITIKEIYYDKSGISLGLDFNGISPYVAAPEYYMYYQDKLISNSFTGEIIESSKDRYLLTLRTNISSELPDNFNAKIVIKEKTDFMREFEFNVPISKSIINTITKEFNIMKTFNSKDRSVLIKKVIFTPESVRVDLDYTRPIDEAEVSMHLYNDKGQEVQLKSYTGPAQINETNRTDTYNAIFYPLNTIPSQLELDFKDSSGSKMLLSTKFDLK